MILPSDVLKEIVEDIVSIKRSNLVSLTVHLLNHTDQSFTIDDAQVTTFVVDQNALNNVFDNITMTMDITPIQFQKLITKQSDLFADIILEYVDRQTYEVILSESPLVLRYKVFLHDTSSLLKRFGVGAFEKTDENDITKESENAVRVPITMQLISEIDHKVNRGSFVGMVQDSTADGAIRYVASVLQIPKIKMVEPDNKSSFQHLNVPPENSGFRVVFDYIHQKYGVYANGFRHYLTNGTMYVYPPFRMDAEGTPRLTVFRVSENSYAGTFNFHDIEASGNVQIVSNTQLMSKNLSSAGSENDGNTKVFVRADGMIDGQVAKGKTKKLTNVTASLSSSNDNSISKDAAVPKYVAPTTNIYEHGTSFSESNTEIMSFGWPNARLGLLYPSMPLSFVFDEKNKVMEKKGLLEAVTYTFTRVSGTIFMCHAMMIIRVDPKQEEYDT